MGSVGLGAFSVGSKRLTRAASLRIFEPNLAAAIASLLCDRSIRLVNDTRAECVRNRGASDPIIRPSSASELHTRWWSRQTLRSSLSVIYFEQIQIAEIKRDLVFDSNSICAIFKMVFRFKLLFLYVLLTRKSAR